MKTTYPDAGSSTISKYKKCEKNHTKHIIIRLLKNSDSKKTLKSIRRKKDMARLEDT